MATSMATTHPSSVRVGQVQVPRWQSEGSLFTLAVVLAVPIWLLLIVTVVGLFYALMIGIFLVGMQALFMAHIRGNGVKIGPTQLPELHRRVQEIARQLGLDPPPDVYVMQAGGALNAFATRFLGSDTMVLYADLMEACGANVAARDMIIGHELGHIHAGHLRWRWLIGPAMLFPLLTYALSRAREYTCDRYGAVAAGNREDAELGLLVLAAGGKLAPHVNRQAFLLQQNELRGFWMGFAQLFSTHPPLTKRVRALREFRV